jgi:acetyl esterase
MDYEQKYKIYKQKYLKCKLNTLQSHKNIGDLMEEKTKIFTDSLVNKTPLYNLSIMDARKVLNDIQVDESYKNIVDIETFIIPTTKVGNVQLDIFRPKNNKNKLPAIMYYHGGGWILGNKQTHGRLLSEICTRTETAVIFVDYTPAPEQKYPTQIIQAYDAMKYIVDNAHKHNLNTNNLIIMGDSVGGNMTTIVAMLSSERNGPKISYQILMYPVTDASMSTESYQIYENGPWLTKKAMEWFFNAYEPDVQARTMATISPINATPQHIKNLPSTLIIVGENDPLRDEVEAYAHKLMNAGVEVTAVRYLGTTHDFLMLDPLKNTPAVKSALKLIAAHIKEIISK